jgi:hypothetical protein
MDQLKAVKNYDYTWELISLFARIIINIVIEVLIALLFGFRAKKQLLIIAGTNIITQSLLNILLNITNYKHGSMMFVFNYAWMEVFVFIIEAAVYSVFLKKFSGLISIKRWSIPMYALTANAVSFILGLLIARVIPGIF